MFCYYDSWTWIDFLHVVRTRHSKNFPIVVFFSSRFFEKSPGCPGTTGVLSNMEISINYCVVHTVSFMTSGAFSMSRCLREIEEWNRSFCLVLIFFLMRFRNSGKTRRMWRYAWLWANQCRYLGSAKLSCPKLEFRRTHTVRNMDTENQEIEGRGIITGWSQQATVALSQ